MVDGRRVPFVLRTSRSARRIRVRVGPAGVEVIHPATRPDADAEAFLAGHGAWLLSELARVERLGPVRAARQDPPSTIPLRGEPRRVVVVRTTGRASHRVLDRDDHLTVIVADRPGTPPGDVLERWLRRQARRDIEQHITALEQRLGRSPRRVYVMDQRTKWGNCAATGNLSFNWRLVMAPAYVLEYLVVHEMVHLVVPDHSSRFWLTVQSLCPESERARRWLAAGGETLRFDVAKRIEDVEPSSTGPSAYARNSIEC